jgi:hemoglobin
MNLKMNTLLTAIFTSTVLLLANPVFAEVASGHSPNLGNTPMEGTETFQAFGGKEGLVKIMDDFMVGLVADPRTKPFFDNNKQAHIKAMLVEQMCELMNGGCKYPGRDMTS